ncbi:MAG: hypothetical protein JJ902_21415 [Roseibium sp.]|nr:hypothetical protein [Roseibium sp.]
MKSILFVPATRTDLVQKAAQGAADAVCLDLEDGVAPGEKAAARQSVAAAVAALQAAGKTVLLRINSEVEHISHDLEHCPADVDLVVLPMTGSRHQIRQLSDWADRRFGQGGPKIVAMIEEPGGLSAVVQGDGPLPHRLTHLSLGTEDFAASLGCPSDGGPVHAAFHRLSQAAAEWGRALLGYPGSIAEFRDIDQFRSYAAHGRHAGAIGGFAIHPTQVPVLNELFGIDTKTKDQAERVVAAFERALAEGLGATQLDGRMIDRPVYLAARKTLQRA